MHVVTSLHIPVIGPAFHPAGRMGEAELARIKAVLRNRYKESCVTYVRPDGGRRPPDQGAQENR